MLTTRRLPIAFEGVVLALGACTLAHAGTFVLMDETELASRSRAVVIGWVTGVRSAPDDTAGGVNTYVSIEPSEVIAGSLPDGEMVLREPGGHVSGQTEKICGTASYTIGEHVLVFLSQYADGVLHTTALAMGNTPSVRSPTAG